MFQFVGNATLWGADKLEVRVTIYRDMDLGKNCKILPLGSSLGRRKEQRRKEQRTCTGPLSSAGLQSSSQSSPGGELSQAVGREGSPQGRR